MSNKAIVAQCGAWALVAARRALLLLFSMERDCTARVRGARIALLEILPPQSHSVEN